MTFDDILHEYFLEKVIEKPDITIEEFSKDEAEDSAWIEKQQQEIVKEAIKEKFSRLKRETTENDFEEIISDTT